MKKAILGLVALLVSVPSWGASIISDTEIQSVVGDLISPVVRAANVDASRAKLHIVADDDFNAFVMGGEDIYIYSGLLTRVKTPNALRAVLAHELGHTVGGHMAQLSERMAAEMKRTMLIQALGLGLMVAGGNSSLGAGVMAGASGIARQSVLSFSRDEERMADNLGLDLMVRANYNPNGFLEVFEQMRDMNGYTESRINPNNVNHPLTSERLANVREKIAGLEGGKKYNNDKQIKPRYDLVRAKLVGYLDNFDRVKTLYPYTDKSDAAIYARAIANMRGGNLSGAQVGAKTLVSRNPKNPYFYELLGDIEYKYGHFDDSITAYEHSLKILGSAPQIETALALVFAERNKPGDKERAVELCKKSLLVSPEPMTYFVLARAYGEQDGRFDWAMAEYYTMQKDRDKAKQHARRAKQRLNPDAPEYIKSNDILKN